MKKNKRKFNNFKKSIKNFMQDENGFITKKNMLKIGLGTISALGIIGSLSNSFAGYTDHASHTNSFDDNPTLVGDSLVKWRITHSNSTPHSEHSSY